MKKLIAILLAFTLMFSFMAVPASAKVGNVGGTDTSIELGAAASLFDRIGDFFHDLIAKIFNAFGADCPICDNHSGYGDAEGDGDYNREEVAQEYNLAINKIKMHKTKLRIDCVKDITVKATELPSMGSLQEKVNAAIKEISGRVESGKNFSYNQQGKISNLIPPSSKESALSGADVKTIKSNKVNDTVVISFTLVDTEAYYDGSTTTSNGVYERVLTPINLGKLELDGITNTDANIFYTDTKVEAAIDDNDNLLSLKTSTNYKVTVNAEAGIDFSAAFEGTIVEEFDVTY